MLKSIGLSLAASLEKTLSRKQPPLREIRNFLLLQYPKALGTAIHATPLIDALHASIPGARIIVTASGAALELLANNPGIERLIPTPDPVNDLRGAVSALRAAKIFAGEPYAALQSQGNERSKITLATMLSGGHMRVGFAVLQKLTAAPLKFEPALSQIENNLRIVATLGHGEELAKLIAANRELLEPRVFPTEAHKTSAHTLLAEQGIDEQKPIAVFISQTSVTQRKSWRPERFHAVAEMLSREYGMQIVFVGAKGDVAAVDELRAPMSMPTANFAGRTSILELCAVLQLADIALALDTGPMHLARAMRLPMVIVAPAWSPPIEWLPLGNPRARILKNADMPKATLDYIIDEVSITEVEQNLRELLALYPPRSFNWASESLAGQDNRRTPERRR